MHNVFKQLILFISLNLCMHTNISEQNLKKTLWLLLFLYSSHYRVQLRELLVLSFKYANCNGKISAFLQMSSESLWIFSTSYYWLTRLEVNVPKYFLHRVSNNACPIGPTHTLKHTYIN